VVLAIAATTGCAGFQGFKFRGTTAASFLRTIEEDKDPNVRFAAYDSLSSPRCYDDEGQKERAARTLVEKLKSGHEPNATRAVICRTLGQLRKPEAREAILRSIEDEDTLVRAEACRALGKVGRSEDATILARVMTTDVTAECRVAAIESLGELKAKDRRINEFLVSGMEHEEPAIRVASMNALKSITGKNLGVDPLVWKKYIETLPDDKPAAAAAAPSPPTPPARPAPPDDGIR
jgi:HEAT repeat protein